MTIGESRRLRKNKSETTYARYYRAMYAGESNLRADAVRKATRTDRQVSRASIKRILKGVDSESI